MALWSRLRAFRRQILILARLVRFWGLEHADALGQAADLPLQLGDPILAPLERGNQRAEQRRRVGEHRVIRGGRRQPTALPAHLKQQPEVGEDEDEDRPKPDLRHRALDSARAQEGGEHGAQAEDGYPR